jgi:hypothetical protein
MLKPRRSVPLSSLTSFPLARQAFHHALPMSQPSPSRASSPACSSWGFLCPSPQDWPGSSPRMHGDNADPASLPMELSSLDRVLYMLPPPPPVANVGEGAESPSPRSSDADSDPHGIGMGTNNKRRPRPEATSPAHGNPSKRPAPAPPPGLNAEDPSGAQDRHHQTCEPAASCCCRS